MLFHLLAVGDVVGDQGLSFLDRHLRILKKLHAVDFTVVNGENASGVGITPRQAKDIFNAGADVITLGNHTWNRIQIAEFPGGQPLHPPPRQLHQPGPRPGLGGL